MKPLYTLLRSPFSALAGIALAGSALSSCSREPTGPGFNEECGAVCTIARSDTLVVRIAALCQHVNVNLSFTAPGVTATFVPYQRQDGCSYIAAEPLSGSTPNDSVPNVIGMEWRYQLTNVTGSDAAEVTRLSEHIGQTVSFNFYGKYRDAHNNLRNGSLVQGHPGATATLLEVNMFAASPPFRGLDSLVRSSQDVRADVTVFGAPPVSNLDSPNTTYHLVPLIAVQTIDTFYPRTRIDTIACPRARTYLPRR